MQRDARRRELETKMADLIIIAYDSEAKAEAARQELLKLQKE